MTYLFRNAIKRLCFVNFVRFFGSHAVQSYPFWHSRNYFEKYHAPYFFSSTLSPIVDEGVGTRLPNQKYTPDFRLKQELPEPYHVKKIEGHRPYRISPHFKILTEFPDENRPHLYGCYCTTAFKRLTPLAGCALLTVRHVLTTATSTELVLRRYKKKKNLENILGFWYETSEVKEILNTSYYGTPARIHYHPLYTYPKHVNRSHPLPVMFDLALWAATNKHRQHSIMCERASPRPERIRPATLDIRHHQHLNFFGFQFVKAYNRNPYVWFKYLVRGNPGDAIVPCPKSEWGQYHCIKTGAWAPLGMDHGAALHRMSLDYSFTGLMGMNVLSMKLRSPVSVSYFIDLTNHFVLEWLHKSYKGRLPAKYLDDRFEDTVGKSPQVKRGQIVPLSYTHPVMYYSDVHCCRPGFFRPGNFEDPDD